MNLSQSPNLNYLWSALIVEELIRNGVDYFCISPGSRSGPLAYAVAENPKAKSIVHFDERASAFHALGYVSASGRPAVVITTSGSAVGNLFPAVIEASKKKLPLIVITADRPPELRHTGANQTIDQIKIFGDYAKFFIDLPTPTTDIPAEYVLTTVDQLVHRSQAGMAAPVHLNCMFREPLDLEVENFDRPKALKNIKSWLSSTKPYTKYLKSDQTFDPTKIDLICQNLNEIKNGIIAVGKLKTEGQRKAVIRLSEKLQWPIFADVTSGLRLNRYHPHVITYFDQLLNSDKVKRSLKIDGALQIGGRMTSKRFGQFIDSQNLKHYIMLLNHPLRNDPDHKVTLRIEGDSSVVCTLLVKKLKDRAANPTIKILQKLSVSIEQTLEKFSYEESLSEISTAYLLSKHAPSNHHLFLASSLPVREMDMYGALSHAYPEVGANRGASGIDGTIASAVGFSNGLKQNVSLLIGDLAFLYDLNSLTMLKANAQTLTIVVLNNNGGGIFAFLPHANNKKHFEKFFGTPHHLSFHHAAEMFDLNYARPQSNEEFVKSYQLAVKAKRSTIIEIVVKKMETVAVSKQIQAKITSNLNKLI